MVGRVRFNCLSEEGTVADMILAKPDSFYCPRFYKIDAAHCFIEILSSKSCVSFSLELFKQPDYVSENPLCCTMGA